MNLRAVSLPSFGKSLTSIIFIFSAGGYMLFLPDSLKALFSTSDELIYFRIKTPLIYPDRQECLSYEYNKP
jgi:hypothetical protein